MIHIRMENKTEQIKPSSCTSEMLALRRWRQENCCELVATLVYTMSFRLIREPPILKQISKRMNRRPLGKSLAFDLLSEVDIFT